MKRKARSLVKVTSEGEASDEYSPFAGSPPPPATTSTGARERQGVHARAEKIKQKMIAATLDGLPPNPAGQSGNPFTDFLEIYRDDPVGFVRNVLKADPLPWQEDFLRAIARGERRISVRAGHGVGKSTACSWALLWHALTRFPQKAVCTAPTASQLFDALFSELKAWVNKLPPFLRDLFLVLSDRIVLKSAPNESFISARTSTAERPEALSGVHSEHVLLIGDEASAIPEQIYESAVGSMSSHNAATVLISNPTKNTGLFYRTHHELSDTWHTMHVSCLGNKLVAADFVKQIIDTYGLDSNAYRVRVLGEFAMREDEALIAAELVDAAMNRDIAINKFDPLVYGVDVARFGNDRTVICKRQGNVVTDFKVFNQLDLMQIVGWLVNEAKTDKPYEICVDTIGLGAGVADRLRDLQRSHELVGIKFSVRDVNVSEACAMNPSCNRLRDELWVAARDFLRTKACKIPKDEGLRQELCGPTYNFTSSGKLIVEGKKEMKKRGLRSPDKADALCLTFASDAATVGGRGPRWVTGEALKRNISRIV